MMSDQAINTAPPKGNIRSEIESLKTPPSKSVASPPAVGSYAPSSRKLPLPDGRNTIIVFLRHCGCPFAEKTFKVLTKISNRHKDIHCIGVSHSSAQDTDNWIPQVGGTWLTDMVIDEERDLYAQWGLGLSSVWSNVGPFVLYSAFQMGTKEGIWNRPTESGSRWQSSGAFAIDKEGVVRWAHIDKAANDLPNLKDALKALEVDEAAISP